MIKNEYGKHKYKIALLFVSGLITGILSVLPMKYLQKTIDFLSVKKDYEFVKYIILYVAMYLCAGLVKIFFVNFGSRFEIKLNKIIRENIVFRVLGTKIDLLERYGKSNTFNIVVDDLKVLEGKLIPLVFEAGFSFSSFLIGSIIVFFYDYVMLIVMIIISIIVAFLINMILIKSETASCKSQMQRLAVLNKFYDIITGVRDIKLFNNEKAFYNEFVNENESLSNSDLKIINIKNFSQTMITLLFNIILAVIVVVGAFRVINGELSVGALVAIMMYVSMITDPIFNILERQKEIVDFKNSIKRLDNVFNFIKIDDLKFVDIFNTISLKNVSVMFNDNLIFDKFNLDIDNGDKVKINGKTGSGKSTIAKLIINMRKPLKGSVLVDDKENVCLKSSVVFQDNKLFNLSIIDNICFKRNVSSERLQKIIGITRVNDVIEKYKDVPIGFDFSTLSGGEKTRVLLARALCNDSELYIFDEISTGLDEKLFYDIFDDVMKFLSSKTVIVIEHKYLDETYFNKSILIGETYKE